jgi:hypothetical protein
MFAHFFLSLEFNLQFTWADVYGAGTAHKRMHTADCGKGWRVGRNAKSETMLHANLLCFIDNVVNDLKQWKRSKGKG